MKAEIISKLNTYITGEILKRPDKTLSATEALISGGLIDSFSLVDLSLFVEQTWGVRLDDTELNAETFDTLEQLAGLIEARAS
ncbi:MAG: acyl carrier protein [Anaerolineales bacterium]|nr:acyl carrier protein [Anaerolineales bacterium]MCW5856176.1 acyl carrier protein [Anaerolineales bacterium]